MRYFKSYLREHIKGLALFCVFAGIFWIVFFLSGVPTDPVLYAFVLCVILGGIVGIVDYVLYFKRRHQLELEMLERPFMLEHLPKPNGALETDYQAFLFLIKEELDHQMQLARAREQDALDYYTLWAHQIKTPLSAIHLLMQARQIQDSELENELFKIEQYVEMVLGYQRMQSESSDLVFKRQPLDPIIRQAIRKYARQFIRKKLTLDYRETDLIVLSDEKWLCFMLEQVLSNALKYTSTGKITIRVSASTLMISDTGIGIRPEDLPRIFEKGYTGYNGRADKKSTGIGLYLCRMICKKLGHTISVTSHVGRGTTVYIGLDFVELEHE
jgi:signal transduction histidine kinase